MISSRPMRDSEYPGYLEYFLPDYAAEISTNYGLSSLEALVQAKREIAHDLPYGVDTPGEVVLCVVNRTSDTESVVGYLWYRPDLAARSAFIKDFHIFAQHQGKGLGKQALNALEAELSRAGFEQIKLRVAEDNKRAKHVYETTGFRVTGVNMSKTIKSGL
ncbi:GNAT family N-acetyltransferase [Phyllobacterium brassicacearum]|uniref:GNAT family N-acetyltransferase n=1 Tax=Phyllobacterium brassicacearum TaxID=314235 RepID=A0A2P7BQE3_9HYPH|nr:GNAT family N-acetyltransferase [Phyllobacterium brassicacearum]PSH68690.1 GNAT family N-acetyltransferase [Phyllobacterium brassicacearum]TDQ24246.1 RimJ/RimL family protein N-acetyltransferase [Phyllobacterium brassicacearum]